MTITAAAPTRNSILSLYREFLRNSKQLNNYNFREYFLRRSKHTFRELAQKEDKVNIKEQFEQLQRELAVLKRQRTISQMYTFDKLVVERVDHGKH
ncbi:HDL093Wp [Eremothecium sinecaudum]|uniref:HDL093Wp n=1 Tax=Eremothecium sinecaudum TaxID=45286 RepID=A0A0X8HRM0_9SACH|nr:HDL093Wp [Eremothecium sinecaudum]AMD20651.1 HDL093Wp [Eremothecium sinecaudum]